MFSLYFKVKRMMDSGFSSVEFTPKDNMTLKENISLGHEVCLYMSRGVKRVFLFTFGSRYCPFFHAACGHFQ